MSYNLCIDIGNTNAKFAVFEKDDNTVLEQYICKPEQLLDKLNAFIAGKTVKNAILCSVIDQLPGINEWLATNTKFYMELNKHTRLPFVNAYTSVDTLGSDRLAMAAGAVALYPHSASLIIALGSCITYNLILSNKFFRGGAIAPGMRMRFKALQEFTDKLPLVQPEGDAPILGYDTETSIRSGVVNGIVAEIESMVAHYKAEMRDDFNPILTGGDMPFFEPLIKNKIFASPDILMVGLNEILNYNAPLF